MAEASKKLSQATSSPAPLGLLPRVLIPAAPPINSPHSDLHLGGSFPEHPAHSTASPASDGPPLPAEVAPLSADPQPLLVFLLYFGFSASLTMGPRSLWSLIPREKSASFYPWIFASFCQREYKMSLLSPHTHIPPPLAASQETGSMRWGLGRRNANGSLYLPVAQPSRKLAGLS